MNSTLILVLLTLLALAQAQQVCLHQECQDQLNACDATCITKMGQCTFSCTLSSLGCMQQCIGDHQQAQDLL